MAALAPAIVTVYGLRRIVRCFVIRDLTMTDGMNREPTANQSTPALFTPKEMRCSHSTSFEWFKRATPENNDVPTERARRRSGRDLPVSLIHSL